MPKAKKLIEVALPLDAINRASAREKSIRHGHPSTLHLWWARRPLAAARAVLFSSLVEDPDDTNALPAFVAACRALPGDGPNVRREGDSPRMRLFDFIERLVKWEATTDESIMRQARALIHSATGGQPPPLWDPFAGGGSIPLEAQRLGLEAHASDLNPVAVLINKAMIEIPPRFADMPPVNPRDRGRMGVGGWRGAAGLAADVRYYGEWMRQRAFERIGQLYPRHNGETVIAWLWARTVISPNPAVNAPVPLASSFVLSKKKGRECWARPVIEGKTVRFEVTKGSPPDDAKGTMIRRQGAKCIISGASISFDYIKREGKAGRLGAQLMAIVTQGKRGRNYHNASDEQAKIAESAKPEWRPAGEMEDGNQNVRGRMWGFRDFADLFTPRQLTALTTFSDLVHEARQLAARDALAAWDAPTPQEGSGLTAHELAEKSPLPPRGGGGLGVGGLPLREGGDGARAYGEAVSVYLAFAVDKAADNLSSNCTWIESGENMRTVFARQAIPMVWDYAEANPFSQSVGCWENTYDRVVKGKSSVDPSVAGYATQADAQSYSPAVTPPHILNTILNQMKIRRPAA